jgi:hypothetical protein
VQPVAGGYLCLPVSLCFIGSFLLGNMFVEYASATGYLGPNLLQWLSLMMLE